MKRILLIFSVAFCSITYVKSQSNLVLNPSFENYIDTESFGFYGYGAFRDNLVLNWSDPNHSSTDLYTSKSSVNLSTFPFLEGIEGFQYPRTGNCFAGGGVFSRIGSSFREYMQASFRESLEASKVYAIKYYLALNDYSSCFSDFGFYFTDTLIDTYEIFHFSKPFITPQYENPSSNIISVFDEWKAMRGNYSAHGGEKYFTVGNFTQDTILNTSFCTNNSVDAAYFYIDDVAVYDTAIIDTIQLCMNDSE